MRTTPIVLLIAFILFIDYSNYKECNSQIKTEIKRGDFTSATHLIDSIVSIGTIDNEEKQALLFTKDSLRRVSLDFNKRIDDIIDWIEKNHGFTPTQMQIDEWEREGMLEYRIIDKEKRYFRNAAPNLFRLSKSARELSNAAIPKSDVPKISLLEEAFANRKQIGKMSRYQLKPKTMRVKYTLTVKPDVVPEGKVIKAWLPYPREDVTCQTNVKFINASHENYILSKDTTAHTSIYMECMAKASKPTVFTVEYEFTSQGEWIDFELINNKNIIPYPDTVNKYTLEKTPHIIFTDNIKQITDSITQNTTSTTEVVKKIYNYIVNNYPWASALEYSTINNIPEYVIKHKKGDCGQVALLLITMLRYKNIPARWQSGWMMHPGEVNLHDWAEYYVSDIGWIPLDISFARADIEKSSLPKRFFISGIDSYRLYINNDFSGHFYPPKKFPRSETVDFQRGEVETDNENLYFDKWSYSMQVEYL